MTIAMLFAAGVACVLLASAAARIDPDTAVLISPVLLLSAVGLMFLALVVAADALGVK